MTKLEEILDRLTRIEKKVDDIQRQMPIIQWTPPAPTSAPVQSWQPTPYREPWTIS